MPYPSHGVLGTASIVHFIFRFVSRHNTNHRANGEATAHSNQAPGAFWSRVTPPELLYIWLLSFDELWLGMNAHLPVVRPLLSYARRGATPMHQNNRWVNMEVWVQQRIKNATGATGHSRIKWNAIK